LTFCFPSFPSAWFFRTIYFPAWQLFIPDTAAGISSPVQLQIFYPGRSRRCFMAIFSEYVLREALKKICHETSAAETPRKLNFF